MRAMIYFILLLTVGFSHSFAAEESVTFEGDRFVKKYVANPAPDEFLVGFLPETETQEAWSKMVTYRYERLPGIGNDPKKAAQLMANTLKSFSAKAENRIATGENDAILDSTSLTLDQKYIGLDVCRFAKSMDGEGVVSIQLAYLVKVALMPPAPWDEVVKYKNGLDYIRSARASWPDKIGAFNMRDIEAELTKSRHNQAVNTDAAR